MSRIVINRFLFIHIESELKIRGPNIKVERVESANARSLLTVVFEPSATFRALTPHRVGYADDLDLPCKGTSETVDWRSADILNSMATFSGERAANTSMSQAKMRHLGNTAVGRHD